MGGQVEAIRSRRGPGCASGDAALDLNDLGTSPPRGNQTTSPPPVSEERAGDCQLNVADPGQPYLMNTVTRRTAETLAPGPRRPSEYAVVRWNALECA